MPMLPDELPCEYLQCALGLGDNVEQDPSQGGENRCRADGEIEGPEQSGYFESLREKGETDFEFEDEYFFTLPAISQMSLD